MAFKLNKQEDAQRADLVNKLTSAREALDAKIEDLQDAFQTAVDALEDEVRAYNETLEQARGFCADTAAQAEEDFGDKSERWQEGERGEQAREWIDAWEQADLEDAELPEVPRIEIELADHADVLDQLPTEAEF
jgi:TolA-binding protein